MLSRIKRIIAALAVTVAAVAIPGAAHAADGNITIPINQVSASGAKTSAMTGSVAEYSGDCSMNVPSFVTINPPTATGTVLIQWEGWGYTRHTSGADIWNLYLNLRDASGNFVLSAPVMHGASMTVWYQVYGWDRFVSLTMTQAQFNRIQQVQWLATC